MFLWLLGETLLCFQIIMDNVLVSFPFFLQHQQTQVQATNDVYHKWANIIIKLNN